MEKKVPVGISARHIHLCQKDLDALFGKDYQLVKTKDLSQPGQFAAEEKVTIISAAGKSIEGVRVLGPIRPKTQVEISRSDAIRGKFVAPVCSSGSTACSGGCRIVGPKGEVEISEGVMVADRHIHFSLAQGEEFGVVDGQVVSVKVEGQKGGLMNQVLCRVKDCFLLDFHIDTDDACAFGLNNGDLLEIVK